MTRVQAASVSLVHSGKTAKHGWRCTDGDGNCLLVPYGRSAFTCRLFWTPCIAYPTERQQASTVGRAPTRSLNLDTDDRQPLGVRPALNEFHDWRFSIKPAYPVTLVSLGPRRWQARVPICASLYKVTMVITEDRGSPASQSAY